jgi:hypothetical protein
MNTAFVITAVLFLGTSPAFSQNYSDSDKRDSVSRRDRDLEDILRSIGEHGHMGEYGHEGRSRGAGFFLRHGDATVAVRCDPQESMRACVDATLTLLERARSMQPSGGTPPGGTPGGQPPSH